MIDMMKRLAELDAKNPNVQTEGIDFGANRQPRDDVPTNSGDANTDEIQALVNMLKLGEIDYAEFRSRLDDLDQSGDDAEQDPDYAAASAQASSDSQYGDDDGYPSDERSSTGGTVKREPGKISHYMKEGKSKAFRHALATLSPKMFESKYNMTKSYAHSELTKLRECGPMTGSYGSTPAPAAISITAANGPELSGMLRDIMSLAGVKPVTAADLGSGQGGSAMSNSPVMNIGQTDKPQQPPMPAPAMRAIIDTLHSGEQESEPESAEYDDEEGEEEIERESYDNTPNDPTKLNAFDANEYAHQENQPGAGNAANGKSRNRVQSTATMEAAHSNLMSDYAAFVNESKKKDDKKAPPFGKKAGGKSENPFAKKDSADKKKPAASGKKAAPFGGKQAAPFGKKPK